MRFALAHDFGKQRDYATDVIASRSAPAAPIQVSFLVRYPLGTTYQTQAAKIAERLGKLRQTHPGAQIVFLGDATGVGQAALEFVEGSSALTHCDAYYAVTFSGGDTIKRGKRPCDVSVPKWMLVRDAQAVLGAGMLLLPPANICPDVKALEHELRYYVFKPGKAKRDRLRAEAARTTAHDDLISALLLAIFGLTY